MTGLVVAAAVLVTAAAFGLLRLFRDGRVRSVPSAGYDLAALGVRPGRVTLLQFSSAFCAPCRATGAILSRAASGDVDHVEVDAAEHLDAARALNIWRTPTTLIIDPAGRVVGRAVGKPTLAQVRESIGVLHD